ncbi:MAG TPA: hypothetical protein VMG59_00935 [Phycisphaerae bacterium]|nr:hypothetical protein [Phycisphaerae bacterium]
MSINYSAKNLMSEFHNAYNEARKYLFNNIGTMTSRLFPGDRFGELIPIIDFTVSEIYGKVAKRHGMLIISAEQQDITEKQCEAGQRLLILNPIDGTINMRSGLSFGVNIAFGEIPKNGQFIFQDIQGVFIADYLTTESFCWINGQKCKITPPQYDGIQFRKPIGHVSDVYEIPDEKSYTPRNYPEGMKRQSLLLKKFRHCFNSAQRRAIDQTGLRMLQVLTDNLVAYGDVRHATKIWNTVPSIKFILEYRPNNYIVMRENFKPYTNRDLIFKIDQEGHLQQADCVGNEVIVIHNKDVDKFKSIDEKDLTDQDIPAALFINDPRLQISRRKKAILLVMLALEAFDHNSRKTTNEIALMVEPNNTNTEKFKIPISELHESQFIDTAIGSGGGCWLTPFGRDSALLFHEQEIS